MLRIIVLGLRMTIGLLWSAGYGPTFLQATQIPSPSPSGTTAPALSLASPLAGQAIQGSVPINGNTAIPDFASAEISFTYSSDAKDTWFLIAESDVPVQDGLLAQWDTTTITDGIYNLRLAVKLDDGSTQEVLVEKVRVRNYSPVETDTPVPTETPVPGATPAPTFTPTPTFTPVPPTGTAIGANPVQIHTSDLGASLSRGVFVAFILFALFGLYILLRNIARK